MFMKINELYKIIAGSFKYYVGTYLSVQEHDIYFMAWSSANSSIMKFVQTITIYTVIMIDNSINFLLVS